MNLTMKIIFLLCATIVCVSSKQDRVRLKDVETLTLYSDRWTTSRRSSPVKQLTCVGGSCNRANLQTAQCYNRGFDGNDVQWECKAVMPDNYKFGRLEVSCEGYEYPDDDYILTGSCGLEYTIEEISKSSNSYFSSFRNLPNDVSSEGSSMLTYIVIIAGAIGLYYYFRPSNNTTEPRPEPRPRPESYPSDPPPPYGFRSDYQKTSDDSYRTTGASSGPSPSAGTSNGPGFFSGMATGGLLGYLFGNRGNTGYTRRGYQDSSFYNNPSSSGYSSFSRPSYSGGRSSTSTSTSTGFASTKRR